MKRTIQRLIRMLVAATLLTGGVAVLSAPPAHASILGGKTDVIGRDASTKDLYLYPGNGSNGFTTRSKIGTNWGAFDQIFSAGDFNRDLRNDVIARNASTGELLLYPGNGAYGFTAPSVIGTGWGSFTALFSAGDFDSDGKNDVIARAPNGDLLLYSGNGAYGFLGSHKIGNGWGAFTALFSAGDFDRDGHPDVIARAGNGDLLLYSGNGVYGFLGSRKIGNGWGGFDALFSSGDFDRDGNPDVIGRVASSGDLLLYRGNGSDGFLGSQKIGQGWGGFDILFSAGDFNKDGIPPGTDTLSRPVYFIHGFSPDGRGFDAANYWGNAIYSYRYDGNPAYLTGPALTWCYYDTDTNCDIKTDGTRNTSILTLGQILAWNIWDTYSRKGIAIDVVAHSMGGLIIKAALTGVQQGWGGFPPFLYVEDVATLGTPHRGVGTALADLCLFATQSTQCQEMKNGSSLLGRLIDNAQAATGTDWTVIGSDDDSIAPPSTSVPDNMTTVGHRVIYDAGQITSNTHMALLDATSGSYAFHYCDYFQTCAGGGRGGFIAVPSGINPIGMTRFGVYYRNYY